jgi:uncharacterized 2Fe-2S/4Fe-4S cluster protein (DUF4445 family)
MQALAFSGIQLRSDCGGKGKCGKCLVEIQEQNGAEIAGYRHVSTGEKPPRLACQTEVEGDLAIEIPPTSLAHAEIIAKPILMRKFDTGRVALRNEAEIGDYGLAVDLGTTTIAVFLCELGEGRVVASGSVRNPQAVCGDDVMSRISSVSTDRANLLRLQEMVVAAVNHTAASLANQYEIKTNMIRKVVVVGNSTMIHLLLGVDPTPIGVYPYHPVFADDRELAAADLGLALHPEARLYTLPLISGFLGSDVIAAAMAGELDMAVGESMIIDVGTNGEVMLNVGGDLSATSCATGPAFEGAAISHGMHAVSGAIDSVTIDPSTSRVSYTLVQYSPAEPKKPTGICGSGIVSGVAALLKAHIVFTNGGFDLQCNHPRLRRNQEGMVEFVLVPGEETQTGADITLTQKDIRGVQLAKGAILTGILLLCQEVNIELPQRFLIAGAFGSFLDRDDAMIIGMLPKVAESAVESVGNAAGEGAILALLNGDFSRRARDIARRTRVVDLASHPDFQKVFLKSLNFPDVQESKYD